MRYMTYEIDDDFDAAINNIDNTTTRLQSVILINGRKFQITLEVVESNIINVIPDAINWTSRFRDSLENMCGNVAKRGIELITFVTYATFHKYSYNVVTTISSNITENVEPKKRIRKPKVVELSSDLSQESEDIHAEG